MKDIVIILADFYKNLSSMLLSGATNELSKFKLCHELITVPGALEIPIAISYLVKSKKNFKAIVILGCIIKGKTDHYSYVCSESMRWISRLSVKHELALGNGLVMANNIQEATERADPIKLNKGGNAVITSVKMLELKKKLYSCHNN